MSISMTVEHNGTSYDGQMATIESTALGYEEHGIFTAYLNLAGPGWGQGAGGYAFDAYDPEADQRVGTAYGLDFIIAVIKTLGLTTWEQVKGARVIALRDGGMFGRVKGITNPDTGKVLIFDEVRREA